MDLLRWAMWLATGLGLPGALMLSSPASAYGQPTAQDALESGRDQSLTGDDLDRFFGPFIEGQLEARHIAGAAVVVVKDGAVLWARGFGYADIAERRPITIEDTVVRPGSISKLFTALAVMQLAEQGRVDLDRDVNEYIDFAIPTAPGGVPVTLRLLLAHRAGFEDHVKDLFAAGTAPPPLGPWLAQALPLRLFPRGDVLAYSNYGYALIGYVVERVSGQRFEEYVQTHLLAPLGMARSTFAQPPVDLLRMVARGYPRSDAAPLPYFETIGPYPTGGLSASPADMGRLMIMLLSGGRSGDRQIVRPESLNQMMALSPGTEDVGLLGFEASFAAGNEFFGKHGLTNAFVSDLELLPEDNVGLFVSYNSASAAVGFPSATNELLQAFARRYFRRQLAPLPDPPPETGDARLVAGAYETSQRADSTFLSLRALLFQMIVTRLPDDRISLRTFSQPLQQVAPDEFRDGDVSLRIVEEGAGQPIRIAINAVALPMVWSRVPWSRDFRVAVPAVLAGLGVMVGTLAAWPFAFFWKGRVKAARAANLDGRLLRLVALLHVVVALGAIRLLTLDPTRFNATLDGWLVALYALAWIGVAGAALTVWLAARCWRDSATGRFQRIHYSLLAAAAVVFAWFCVTWRIAGTTLNY